MTIEEIRARIQPVDKRSMKEAREHWMTVGKPLFSLGKLEEAVIRMAGIQRTPRVCIDKKGLIIMCADNGVVAEGVTQTGQEVTAIVAENFAGHRSSVCLMSDVAGVDIFPVDIGMIKDVPGVSLPKNKVAYGTHNLLHECAMTREEVEQALSIGIRAVEERKKEGYQILATGEMGIGNTTTSSAVASVLLGVPVPQVTGRGAGLSSSGLVRKIQVIEEAIAKHQPDASDIVDVLSKVGGLDIAGLVGVYLGGAIFGLPIVIDGFISAVAALCAMRIDERVRDYMMPSHVSKEPAGAMLLEALGLSPFLTCDMCLGEGSGAVAVLPLLEMGLRVYHEMGTFDDIKVEQYQVLK